MRADGVEMAVALSFPDELRGHQIVAVVQGSADLNALRHLCRTEIGGHAVPREFHVVETIPMLAAGKPDLQTLKHMWDAS
jgi:Acyl-CoA synthetases (AMP-forming)/AMP-acid ligases II